MEEDKKILYHASHLGISGPITPTSRARCDFGKGFYMGTRLNQTLGLVIKDSTPKKYELKLSDESMSKLNIKRLKEEEWFYTVLFHRGILNNFKGTDLYKKYSHILDGVDIAIGKIADDSLDRALRSFRSGLITDIVTMKYIDGVNLGTQFVALTEKGCNEIKILSENMITEKDKELGKKFNKWKMEGTQELLASINRENRVGGKFYQDLLDEAKGIGKDGDLNDDITFSRNRIRR